MIRPFPALLVAALGAAAMSSARGDELIRWKQLASLPDAVGFAGSFIGVADGRLVVAGGANFPDRKPWDGGTKRWYDRAFVLPHADGRWVEGQRLPRPLGYGISISAAEGLLCIGGSDAAQHFADVFALRWSNDRLVAHPLPPLPKPCANACGELVERTIYVAGGIETPQATSAMHTFWALDLDHLAQGWQQLPPWPGPERMLAVAGVHDGSFYLFSGASLTAGADGKPLRRWLRDAYRFSPGRGWRQIADLPRVAVAAPGPAVAVVDPPRLLILGGDDGTQVDVSHDLHRGFPRDVLAYDTAADLWSRAGEVPFSLVTTGLARWQGKIVIPGGEAKPGIRSTEVWLGQIRE